MEKDNILHLKAESNFGGLPYKIFHLKYIELDQREHSHDYMQLWYVKRGICFHRLLKEEYKCQKGDVLIIPPDISHKIIIKEKDAKNTELYCCEFLPKFVFGNKSRDNKLLSAFIADKENIKPIFKPKGMAVKEIQAILEDMLFEYKHKKMFFEQYIKSSILRLLSVIARDYHEDYPLGDKRISIKNKEQIHKAINYINENYNKKIYLSKVCDISSMSPAYFSDLFKQITGTTFSEYINNIRITKAKELLCGSDKSINDIAAEAGFNDPAYFIRLFKNKTGISPGKFRRLF